MFNDAIRLSPARFPSVLVFSVMPLLFSLCGIFSLFCLPHEATSLWVYALLFFRRTLLFCFSLLAGCISVSALRFPCVLPAQTSLPLFGSSEEPISVFCPLRGFFGRSDFWLRFLLQAIRPPRSRPYHLSDSVPLRRLFLFLFGSWGFGRITGGTDFWVRVRRLRVASNPAWNQLLGVRWVHRWNLPGTWNHSPLATCGGPRFGSSH